MKTFKYISIVFLLFGFSFALVQCAKEESTIQSENEKFEYKISDIENAIKLAEKNQEKYKINSTLQFRTDGTGCFSLDTFDCKGDLVFLGSFEREVDVYNNCKAKVKYDLWRCFQSNGLPYPDLTVIFTFYFDNFEAFPIEGDCDSVLVYWEYLLSNNLYEEFIESSETFVRDAQKATEQVVIQEWMDIVGVFFGCDYLSTTLYSEFYTAKCYQDYLKVWISRGVFRWDLIKVKCGESCCKRTTYYCVNDNGEVIPSDPLIEELGECYPILTTPPPDGYSPIGDCEHMCK